MASDENSARKTAVEQTEQGVNSLAADVQISGSDNGAISDSNREVEHDDEHRDQWQGD